MRGRKEAAHMIYTALELINRRRIWETPAKPEITKVLDFYTVNLFPRTLLSYKQYHSTPSNTATHVNPAKSLSVKFFIDDIVG